MVIPIAYGYRCYSDTAMCDAGWAAVCQVMNAVSAVRAAAATLLRTDQREGVRVGGVQGGGGTTRKLQLHFGKTQRWNVLEKKKMNINLRLMDFFCINKTDYADP